MLRSRFTLIALAAVVALTVLNYHWLSRRHIPSEVPRAITTDSIAEVAHQVLPQIVNIYISGTGRNRFGITSDDLFEQLDPDSGNLTPEERNRLWQFHRQLDPETLWSVDSAGSGVIISEDGLVITNHHLFEDYTDMDIEVHLYDGQVYGGDQVELIAQDSLTDLALLRINGSGFAPATFGDSDRVNIGDWVIAIGNPLQLASTVTQGIVSARGREVSQGEIFDYLQTSAHIEPGSSGGALMNMQGELIGINTAIATQTDRWEGFGFALPSNSVKEVVDALREFGRVPRGYIGINFYSGGNSLPTSERRLLGYRGPGGILITSVRPNGPSDLAGLRTDDIIVSVAGQPVQDATELIRTVAALPVGSEAQVELWRGDRLTSEGFFFTADLVIGERPAENVIREEGLDIAPQTASAETFALPGSGIEVEFFPHRYPVVTSVEDHSPGFYAGFRVGDVIQEVNGIPAPTERRMLYALRLLPDDIMDHYFLINRGIHRRHLTLNVSGLNIARAPEITPPPLSPEAITLIH